MNWVGPLSTASMLAPAVGSVCFSVGTSCCYALHPSWHTGCLYPSIQTTLARPGCSRLVSCQPSLQLQSCHKQLDCNIARTAMTTCASCCLCQASAKLSTDPATLGRPVLLLVSSAAHLAQLQGLGQELTVSRCCCKAMPAPSQGHQVLSLIVSLRAAICRRLFRQVILFAPIMLTAYSRLHACTHSCSRKMHCLVAFASDASSIAMFAHILSFCMMKTTVCRLLYAIVMRDP